MARKYAVQKFFDASQFASVPAEQLYIEGEPLGAIAVPELAETLKRCQERIERECAITASKLVLASPGELNCAAAKLTEAVMFKTGAEEMDFRFRERVKRKVQDRWGDGS